MDLLRCRLPHYPYSCAVRLGHQFNHRLLFAMVRYLQEPDYPQRLTLAPSDALTLDDSSISEVIGQAASCANHSCAGRIWTLKRPPTGRLTNGAGTAIILLCLYPHSSLKTTVGKYATLKSIWPEDAFRA